MTTSTVICSAVDWSTHEELLSIPRNFGSQSNQLCREDGYSQCVSHLDMDSNYKTAPIAIGREPDLIFNIDANGEETLIPKITVTVVHLRGMWTETKMDRLRNYHHYLSLALCMIF